MPDQSEAREQAKAEIAKEISQVHLDSYGEPVHDVSVEIGERFIAVVMDIVLSPAEKILLEAGRPDAVRGLREEYQLAIKPVYMALIERASGRRVAGFASRTVVGDESAPWSTEIFRLAPIG